MTTVEAEAARIFADARAMSDAALERLAAGDLRDAAEKAWCATKRATDALILARTGEEPQRSPHTSQALNKLREHDSRIGSLISRYYVRQGHLHGECFYLGLCEPVSVTDRRIRETAQYIYDAEVLAR